LDRKISYVAPDILEADNLPLFYLPDRMPKSIFEFRQFQKLFGGLGSLSFLQIA
jgi:hypothetical protein